MSLPIIILIMLLAGMVGGAINFLLPSNTGEDKLKIRNILSCLAMGIGATILIPLFLEIAQSKLMDNIHYGWRMQNKECDCSQESKDSLLLKVAFQADTSKRIASDTVKVETARSKVTSSGNIGMAANNCCVPLKNYFLFAAYCLLAAAAGFRFINSITDSVLKDKQIAEAQKGKAKAEEGKEKAVEEKHKIEQIIETRVMNSQMSQQQEEVKLRNTLTQERIDNIQALDGAVTVEYLNKIASPVIPILPPVTNANDPQKGRFGGKSENNERKLSATVIKSSIPNFYNVVLTVESTNEANPLISDVIFYIHDSFSPSVFTYKPNEFIDGKVMEDDILSFGAFTVGVITDDGKTLLELDLSEDESFPKEFRER